jgi:hypothetical protein
LPRAPSPPRAASPSLQCAEHPIVTTPSHPRPFLSLKRLRTEPPALMVAAGVPAAHRLAHASSPPLSTYKSRPPSISSPRTAHSRSSSPLHRRPKEARRSRSPPAAPRRRSAPLAPLPPLRAAR